MRTICKTKFLFFTMSLMAFSATAGTLSDVARLLADNGYYVQEFPGTSGDDEGMLSVFVMRGSRILQRFTMGLNSRFGSRPGLTLFSGNGFLSGSAFRDVSQRMIPIPTPADFIERIREYEQALEYDADADTSFGNPYLFEQVPGPSASWFVPLVNQPAVTATGNLGSQRTNTNSVGDSKQLQLIKVSDDSDKLDNSEASENTNSHETTPKFLLHAPPKISLQRDRREMYLEIRESIFRATMLHEILHDDWTLPCRPPDCIPIKDLEKILGTSFSETEDL